jgi:hypothetical protein
MTRLVRRGLLRHQRERIVLKAGKVRAAIQREIHAVYAYFVSNHRSLEHHRRFLAGEAPYQNEVYSVRGGGAHLLGVFQLH